MEWTGDKNPASSGTAINVDAFDVLGGLVTPAGLTRYEQTDSLLAYAGTWGSYSTTSASGGSYKRANTAASVTVHFTGTYLSWVATAGTTTGQGHGLPGRRRRSDHRPGPLGRHLPAERLGDRRSRRWGRTPW